MAGEPVNETRDALLVVVARIEGKFDTSMAELRAGVAAVSQQFLDFSRRTEDKQRELESRLERKAEAEQAREIDKRVDTLWDRHNRQRGAWGVVAFVLTVLSVYATLKASGVHFG